MVARSRVSPLPQLSSLFAAYVRLLGWVFTVYSCKAVAIAASDRPNVYGTVGMSDFKDIDR